MTSDYADWDEQTTLAGKLTRIRLYIKDVEGQMGPRISADAKSRDPSSYDTLYRELVKKRDELEKRAGRARGSYTKVVLADER